MDSSITASLVAANENQNEYVPEKIRKRLEFLKRLADGSKDIHFDEPKPQQQHKFNINCMYYNKYGDILVDEFKNKDNGKSYISSTKERQIRSPIPRRKEYEYPLYVPPSDCSNKIINNIELSAEMERTKFYDAVVKSICMNLKLGIASFGCVCLGLSTVVNPAVLDGLAADQFLQWDRVHIYLLDGDFLGPTDERGTLKLLSRSLFKHGHVRPASIVIPPVRNQFIKSSGGTAMESSSYVARVLYEAISRNSLRYNSILNTRRANGERYDPESLAVDMYCKEVTNLLARGMPVVNVMSIDPSFSICGLNKHIFATPEQALRPKQQGGVSSIIWLPRLYHLPALKTVNKDPDISAAADLFGEEFEAPTDNVRCSDILKQKLQYTATISMLQNAQCQIIVCESIDTWNTMITISSSSTMRLMDYFNGRIRAFVLTDSI